jgi:CRP/FNR family transcriptional regulator
VLGAEQLASLNRRSFRKRYAAGQLIAGVSPAERWCATILAGVVKLTRTLPDGRQQIVTLLFPSDFLGRPFQAAGTCVAEAATEVELCCYGLSDFERLLAEVPEIRQLFLERTLVAVDAAREWMVLLGRMSARERVAALLLLIARRMRPTVCAACDDAPRIELPLSRAEIADCLGLRLETVSRQLNLLEAGAVIRRVDKRGLVLLDIAALERISLSDCQS